MRYDKAKNNAGTPYFEESFNAQDFFCTNLVLPRTNTWLISYNSSRIKFKHHRLMI
jgi:hypothetical protein